MDPRWCKGPDGVTWLIKADRGQAGKVVTVTTQAGKVSIVTLGKSVKDGTNPFDNSEFSLYEFVEQGKRKGKARGSRTVIEAPDFSQYEMGPGPVVPAPKPLTPLEILTNIGLKVDGAPRPELQVVDEAGQQPAESIGRVHMTTEIQRCNCAHDCCVGQVCGCTPACRCHGGAIYDCLAR